MSRADWDRFALDGLHRPVSREPMTFDDRPRVAHGLIALIALTTIVVLIVGAVFGVLTLVRFGLWAVGS